MKLAQSLRLVLWIVGATVRAADNDNFANSTHISGRDVSSTSSYANATLEPKELKIFSFAKGQTLWWDWTAPQDGLAQLDLAGTELQLYTIIGVYQGDNVASLTKVASNINSSVWGASHCDFVAKVGTTYHFVADLYVNEDRSKGVRLGLHLENLPPIASRPANDDFARAASLSGITANASVNNENATGENGESIENGGAAARSVWWRWTAPGDGFIQVDTLGSTTSSGAEMDTILAVYLGFGRSAEESNDDSGSRLTSEVSVAVTRGQEYYIAVMTAPDSAAGVARVALKFLTRIPAPAWAARNLADLPIDSTAYGGQVLLINFWATWCGPCRNEIPDLITLHEKYKHRGFSVIGVSVDSAVDGKSPLSLVGGFVTDYSITYPVLLDQPWGTIELGFGAARSIPTSYIVDRQGNIVTKLVGAFSGVGQNLPRFEQAILPLLGTTAPALALQAARLANGNLELVWETNPSVRLEVRDNMTAAWQPANLASKVREGRQVVTVLPTGATRFYRLAAP